MAAPSGGIQGGAVLCAHRCTSSYDWSVQVWGVWATVALFKGKDSTAVWHNTAIKFTLPLYYAMLAVVMYVPPAC